MKTAKSSKKPLLKAVFYALVELKGAKMRTPLNKVNRHELYCQVELPLSKYPLYGKQSIASQG